MKATLKAYSVSVPSQDSVIAAQDSEIQNKSHTTVILVIGKKTTF